MQRLFLKLIFYLIYCIKTFEKVDDTFNLKNLFTEHVNKFNFKNEQEFYLLDDVKYNQFFYSNLLLMIDALYFYFNL